MARAGSTPRGYDTIGTYGPTSGALRTLHSLETDYGLLEVNAWPIEPLHLHCAVLKLPDGAIAPPCSIRCPTTSASRSPSRCRFLDASHDYNDPYVALQRGFQQMDVADAQRWSQGKGSRRNHRHRCRYLAPGPGAVGIACRNFVDSDAGGFAATGTAPRSPASSPPLRTIMKASSASRPGAPARS